MNANLNNLNLNANLNANVNLLAQMQMQTGRGMGMGQYGHIGAVVPGQYNPSPIARPQVALEAQQLSPGFTQFTLGFSVTLCTLPPLAVSTQFGCCLALVVLSLSGLLYFIRSTLKFPLLYPRGCPSLSQGILYPVQARVRPAVFPQPLTYVGEKVTRPIAESVPLFRGTS